jgi:hypothetical protein
MLDASSRELITYFANSPTKRVTPTQITLAKFNPAGTTSVDDAPLPAHCQVQGIINKRTGSEGFPYGASFELRLPAPAQWNGRFMFQGGGGTEGAVPRRSGSLIIADACARLGCGKPGRRA